MAYVYWSLYKSSMALPNSHEALLILLKAVLWASIEGLSVFIDATLTLIQCIIVFTLQMPRTKYILIVVFSAKIM